MPGTNAQRGDLYNVSRRATFEGDTKDGLRRMVCVAEQPQDPYVWTAMARTTTGGDPTIDLHSPERQDLRLTKEGWWSYRFIRAVRKRMTGDPAYCAFLLTLPEPLRTEVLNHYKQRP